MQFIIENIGIFFFLTAGDLHSVCLEHTTAVAASRRGSRCTLLLKIYQVTEHMVTGQYSGGAWVASLALQSSGGRREQL